MIGKLFNGAAFLSLATMLACGGFAGYLYFAGHVNGPRVELLGKVLSGELDDALAGPDEGAEDAEAVEDAADEPVRTSAETARARSDREHMRVLELERAREDLEAQRRLLDQVMVDVVQAQESLDNDRKTFADERKQRASARVSEGFKKELTLVAGMKAAQAKDYIIRLWNNRKADAVRLLDALDERQAMRILEQMRTPDEMDIMTDLLEQVRLQGTEGYAGTSRRTAGAAAP